MSGDDAWRLRAVMAGRMNDDLPNDDRQPTKGTAYATGETSAGPRRHREIVEISELTGREPKAPGVEMTKQNGPLVATTVESAFLEAVLAQDAPIRTASLAERLGWKEQLGDRRARRSARIVARTLHRRGLLRVWQDAAGHWYVAPLDQ